MHTVSAQDRPGQAPAAAPLPSCGSDFIANIEAWERTFDAIVDPVMILGTRHEIIKANKAMRTLMGEQQTGVQQLICHHCVHHSAGPPTGCPHSRLLSDGKAHSEELFVPALGRHFMVVVSPLFGADGKLQGSVHYARDITEKKKLERQLMQAQKLEAIGTLAGGVAHDFNNILTVILGYGALLQRQTVLTAEAQIYLDGMLSAVDRASTLTHSLLAFSRKKETELRPIDVNRTIRDAERMLKRMVREDIEVTSQLCAEELTVLGDASQLDQVLMNLVSNSQDAIEGPGRISIRTELCPTDSDAADRDALDAARSYVKLTYSDNGCGIDQETQQRIFEPFYTTKEVGKGTGLGLSIVYGIVSQHHGLLRCSSEPGQGTTFEILLPLVTEPVREVAIQAGSWATGSGTVLLAENDAQIRPLLAQILKQSGYRVIEASRGEEAVQRFAELNEEIDLVILDVVMPGLSGREAFRQMRLLKHPIKALFISGHHEHTGPLQEWLGEEVHFLQKPIQPRDLLQSIRKLLTGPLVEGNGI